MNQTCNNNNNNNNKVTNESQIKSQTPTIRALNVTRKSTTTTTNTPTTTTTASTNPLRLLVGKHVYLDINTSYKHTGKLKECLLTIGVSLADCMSKDVNYVITNRIRQEDLKQLINNDDTKLNSHKTSPTFSFSRSSAINRTQTILENASRGAICTDMIKNARRFGISIMHVLELERYVEKYMIKCKLATNENKTTTTNDTQNQCNTNTNNNQTNNQNNNNNNNNTTNNLNQINEDKLNDHELIQHIIENSNNKVRKLKSPYIKFESICKQYRPIYQEFKQWHDLVLDCKTNNSPFQIYFSDEVNGDETSTRNNNTKAATASAATVDLIATPKTTTNAFGQQQQVTQSITRTVSSKCGSSIFDATNHHQATRTPLLQRHNSTISANLSRTTTTTTTTTKFIKYSPNLNKPKQRKNGGYCECCKQRYENLKQHLTSLQHENFEKNLSNFKEIDVYVNDCLNFNKFIANLNEKHELNKENELKTDSIITNNNNNNKNTNLEEIHEEEIYEEPAAHAAHELTIVGSKDDSVIIEEKDEKEEEKSTINTIDQIVTTTTTSTMMNATKSIASVTEMSVTAKKNKKTTKEAKLIDRLIFESTSLGTAKSQRRRTTHVTKYIELSNKDFNCLLSPSTTTASSTIASAIKTPTSVAKKQRRTINNTTDSLNNDAGSRKSGVKRKRKQTVEVTQMNNNSVGITSSSTQLSSIEQNTSENKPKIKLKLERNKSNNSWHISSSSSTGMYEENQHENKKLCEINDKKDDSLANMNIEKALFELESVNGMNMIDNFFSNENVLVDLADTNTWHENLSDKQSKASVSVLSPIKVNVKIDNDDTPTAPKSISKRAKLAISPTSSSSTNQNVSLFQQQQQQNKTPTKKQQPQSSYIEDLNNKTKITNCAKLTVSPIKIPIKNSQQIPQQQPNLPNFQTNSLNNYQQQSRPQTTLLFHPPPPPQAPSRLSAQPPQIQQPINYVNTINTATWYMAPPPPLPPVLPSYYHPAPYFNHNLPRIVNHYSMAQSNQQSFFYQPSIQNYNHQQQQQPQQQHQPFFQQPPVQNTNYTFQSQNHQQQQQQHFQQQQQKRVSLNDSTTNIYDALSAANSLINNFD